MKVLIRDSEVCESSHLVIGIVKYVKVLIRDSEVCESSHLG